MTTLQEYLEQHCEHLLEAVKHVPNGKDLPPWFVGTVGDQTIAFPLAELFGLNKDMALGLFRSALRKLGAEKYAIICAAWYVVLDKKEGNQGRDIIQREGTGTVYKDRRRECYNVVCGDKNGTITRCFDVKRDYKGKIRELVRQDTFGFPPQALTGWSEGRMIDLLAEARH